MACDFEPPSRESEQWCLVRSIWDLVGFALADLRRCNAVRDEERDEMKLRAFRVQNYKRIQDTGWVECQDLMVFVGKNEAGKTALLRGLSKLKPTDGAKYDGLKEFPHGRYTDEFKRRDWPVASARFVIEDEERQELSRICGLLDPLDGVTVTRRYSDRLDVVFEPIPQEPGADAARWLGVLEGLVSEVDASVGPDRKGEPWKATKQNIRNYLNGAIAAARQPGFHLTSESLAAIGADLLGHAGESWQKELIAPWVDRIKPIGDDVALLESLDRARAWVAEKMPHFLYFGSYEVLQSDIYLPEFVARLQNNDRSPKTRVQLALFKHVGADIQEIAALGRPPHGQQPSPATREAIDKLTILADSAQTQMTRKFGGWWDQRRHAFHYEFHGDYFRIWVSDDLDPGKVELEERSEGMRYFFSFYLVFLVEAEEQHRNCILLLDEPGLHLHGTAQAALIRFLERLSRANQLFYTTHSPFMIDGSNLDRARAVYESPGGTCVSNDVWPKDRDTLFPLQAALGYSVWQSLFLSKRQVLVEGPTDYLLLHGLNEALAVAGRTCLRDDVVMLPVGGATNMAPLASMLVGHGIKLAILLDGDRAAQIAEQKLKRILADLGDQCVAVEQISGDSGASEIEDLIPAEYYLDAVRRALGGVELKFADKGEKESGIVDRVNAALNRMGRPRLDKRLPAKLIADDLRSGREVPQKLLAVGERVFGILNGVFGRDG